MGDKTKGLTLAGGNRKLIQTQYKWPTQYKTHTER
jgi:hypothetical protein